MQKEGISEQKKYGHLFLLCRNILQADRHVGESDAEIAEFVTPAHGHGDAELPGLDAPGRVREQADGPGDAAAHKEHDQQEVFQIT